ncbi:hypothetical protein AB1Y20_014784 [Prymnesium parvum]|uniref:START domain-containing protein n=1 Tax=Prymnesium parvum TaxID=97485 RepID=A0AB34IEH4_PRYPA
MVLPFALLPALSHALSVESLTSTYDVFVDTHISELLPLQQADHLNAEWNARLGVQTLLHTKEFGAIVHQVYLLPWPLLPRDLLMKCHRDIDRQRFVVTTKCHSVRHAARPLGQGAVRMEIVGSVWEMEALRDGRTHVRMKLTIPADDSKGMPRFVIDYVQRHSLKDSISNFLKAAKRLQLPAHAELRSWRPPPSCRREAEPPRRHGLIGALLSALKLRQPDRRASAAACAPPEERAAALLPRLHAAAAWACGALSLLIALLAGLAFALAAARRLRAYRSGGAAHLSGCELTLSDLPRPASSLTLSSAEVIFATTSNGKGMRQIRSSPGLLCQLG